MHARMQARTHARTHALQFSNTTEFYILEENINMKTHTWLGPIIPAVSHFDQFFFHYS